MNSHNRYYENLSLLLQDIVFKKDNVDKHFIFTEIKFGLLANYYN